MYISAILYFFVVTYFLGESVAFFLKYNGKDLFENLVMKFGLGLGIFPILTVILNYFHLINWETYFIIAIIIPLFKAYKLFNSKTEEKEKRKFVIKKKHIFYLLLIILFVAQAFIMIKGAYTYPYLEDGDPLSHALAANYISHTGTYSVPADERVTHYLEPYPPFYAAYMSLYVNLSQHDVIWSLKFINALLASLGILFMYFLIKKMTGSDKKALLGAFFLLCINSYLSHFIFAATYSITIIIPFFYFLVNSEEQLKEEKNKLFSIKDVPWNSVILTGIVLSAAVLVQQITAAIMILFLGTYFLLNIRRAKKVKLIVLISVVALLITAIYIIPTAVKYGGLSNLIIDKPTIFLNKPTATGGTNNDSSGGVIYSFMDFLTAPTANKIDQPIGVGIALFILFLMSIVFIAIKAKKYWKENRLTLVYLVWTFILIVLIEGNALPYKLLPHRIWAYMAIGLVLVTTTGVFILLDSIKKKNIVNSIILIIIVATIFTGLIPKYAVQTSYWPPGPEWTTTQELQGYLTMSATIPRATTVYAICSVNEKVAGSNMGVVFLDKELRSLKDNYTLINNSNINLAEIMQRKKIPYIIFDTACAKDWGVNETNTILKKTQQEGFTQVIGNGGFFLLKTPGV